MVRREAHRPLMILASVALIVAAIPLAVRPAGAVLPCPTIIGDSPETMSLNPPAPRCPGISGGTFLGGWGSDWALDVAVDPQGFRFVVGYTGSEDFPITPDAFDSNYNGDPLDVFVAKVDPSGTFVYSTFFGGSDWDVGLSIGVDDDGNAYVTGSTVSEDFPVTTKGHSPSASNQQSFVAKFDPGGQLVYSKVFGGSGEDVGWSIAVDAEGDAYVAGYTLSADFPTTFKLALTGSSWNAFVTKLNPEGSAIVYSTLVGGSAEETAEDIAVDFGGSAYVTGVTSSPDFPVTQEGVRFAGGTHDAFVLKLSPAGDAIVFSTLISGSDYEDANSIAVDAVGNAYVTGRTFSPDFPTTPGAFSRTLHGRGDAFVVKLDQTGDIAYSTFLGGDEVDAYDVDSGWGIAVDDEGHAYVTGEAYSRDFPTTQGALDATYNADRDAFVTKLDSQGASLVYSTFLGGAESDPIEWRGDLATSIAIDSTGNVTVVGGTSAPDFPVTEDAVNPYHAGDVDGFIATLDLVPQPNRPPVAWFVVDLSGEPDRIVVNAYRSADPEDVTALLEVRWDWENDGVWDTDWSTTKTASHEYCAQGQYTIALEVRDTEGLTGRTEKSVAIVAPALTAWASARIVGDTSPPESNACEPQPISGVAPLRVAFESSVSGGTPPVRFAWSFGDGGTSSEEGPIYMYEIPGTYTATLVVTDNSGAQATYQLAIIVLPPLTIDDSFAVIAALDPLTVSLRATPSGGTPPYAYLWDFGDGSTSTLEAPTHTYGEPGNYLVTLTVTDAEGRTVTKVAAVVVGTPAPWPWPSFIIVGVAALGIASAVWFFRRGSRRRAPPT